MDIGSGVRRYVSSMSRARLWLFGAGLLLFVMSLPVDILRHQYVWTSKMDSVQEKGDAYRGLIGHCDCFERDERGHLPACVRAYSTVWSLTTVLQLSLLLLLLLGSNSGLFQLLCGGYAATVCCLLVLFIDCGVLTEDDCFLIYLLLPLMGYALALLLVVGTSSSSSSGGGTRRSVSLL